MSEMIWYRIPLGGPQMYMVILERPDQPYKPIMTAASIDGAKVAIAGRILRDPKDITLIERDGRQVYEVSDMTFAVYIVNHVSG